MQRYHIAELNSNLTLQAQTLFMKYIITLLFVCVTAIATYGQKKKYVETNQLKVNAILPGLVNELGLGKHSTLRVQVSTFFGFNFFPGSDNKNDFAVFPEFDFQYRYYHNFKGRELKGRNFFGNSGDFFGLQTTYLSSNPLLGKFQSSLLDILLFGNIAGFEVLYIGPTYGLQRSFRNGFIVELQLGLGYINLKPKNNGDENQKPYSGIGRNVNFGIGWVLGKRKINSKSPQNQ